MLRGSTNRYFATRQARFVRSLGAAPRLSNTTHGVSIQRLSTLGYPPACAARRRRVQAFGAYTAAHRHSFRFRPRQTAIIPNRRKRTWTNPWTWLIILCLLGTMGWSYGSFKTGIRNYIIASWLSRKVQGVKSTLRHGADTAVIRFSGLRSSLGGWWEGRRRRKAERRDKKAKQDALEEKRRGKGGRKWGEFLWAPKKEKGGEEEGMKEEKEGTGRSKRRGGGEDG